MQPFSLSQQLSKDCHRLGAMDLSLLLLMNNSLVPWFILVPRVLDTELVDLSREHQNTVLTEINIISTFVKGYFNSSKLNVATIGNIVNQLHIHVVGRNPSDYCWPNVVWGNKETLPYSTNQVGQISAAIKSQLGDKFSQKI